MSNKKLVIVASSQERVLKRVALALSLLLLATFNLPCRAGQLPLQDVQVLLEKMGSPSIAETNSAFDKLLQGGDGIVTNVIAVLTNLNSPAQSRANAALVLGSLVYHSKQPEKYDFAIINLVNCLNDHHAAVRLQAVQALGCFGGSAKAAVAPLTKVVVDRDQSLRISALEALGRIGPAARDSLPIVEKALHDPSWEVRIVASEAVNKIRISEKNK